MKERSHPLTRRQFMKLGAVAGGSLLTYKIAREKEFNQYNKTYWTKDKEAVILHADDHILLRFKEGGSMRFDGERVRYRELIDFIAVERDEFDIVVIDKKTQNYIATDVPKHPSWLYQRKDTRELMTFAMEEYEHTYGEEDQYSFPMIRSTFYKMDFDEGERWEAYNFVEYPKITAAPHY